MPFTNLVRVQHALGVLCAALCMTLSVQAQPTQPGTMPSTQPGRGTRGARGPAAPPPQVITPRDEQPWTPANFNSAKPNLPSLIIAGDSTADKGPDAMHRGWAGPLMDYFDTSKINVINLARGGRSFRSFSREGLWDQLLAGVKPGDFVMIQMGHNEGGEATNPNGRPSLPGIGDETQEVKKADGTTEVVHTYGWYAKKWAKDVRGKGATPIFMTSTAYNRWQGEQFQGAGSRAPEIRQVAELEKVQLIDHLALITSEYQKLGKEAVTKLYSTDNLHTSTFGAIKNAELFVAEVKAMQIKPLVDALNDKGKAIEAYKPTTKPAG